jgi:predicted HTH domain antitoxin
MTELLRQAILQLEQLPPEQQDEIATRLLSEIQDEQTRDVLLRFQEGQISSGKAANLLKMNRLDFLALLSSQGINFIDYTADELAEELAAVENLDIRFEDDCCF